MRYDKLTQQLLLRLRRIFADGSVADAVEIIQQASPLLLLALREQKLLLGVQGDGAFKELAAVMTRRASEVLDNVEGRRYGRYVLLVERTRTAFASLTADRVELLEHGFPRLSLADLLPLAEGVLREFLDHVAAVQPSPVAAQAMPGDLPDLVADYERALHEHIGRANDVLFAAARALNEVARITGRRPAPPGRRVREEASARLRALFTLAGEWNGVSYVLDQVSYGTWYVEDIEGDRCRLGLVDPRYELVRGIGIRREHIARITRARGGNRSGVRFLRDLLQRSSEALVDSALLYYEGRTRAVARPPRELMEHYRDVDALLDTIGAEDDLLFMAANGDFAVQSRYLAAFAVRVFRETAHFVREGLPKRLQTLLNAPEIPLEHISGLIDVGPEQRAVFRHALEEVVVDLPAPRHMDVVRSPFVREPSGAARALAFLDATPWPATVRDWIINGGSLGKDVGRTFEGFVQSVLGEGGWNVFGGGTRLKEGSRIVTDVDLFALREGVLLICQVKSVAGAGVVPYDHWRSRGIIEHGARQARLAAELIRKEPERLTSIADRKVRNEVVEVLPVVVSSSALFDGWRCDGIPVISHPTINALTGDVGVRYRTLTGEVHHSVSIAEGSRLDRPMIRSLIEHPLALRVAGEGETVSHRVHRFAGAEWALPEFEPEPVEISVAPGAVPGRKAS
jgi:hypothetical protein